MHILAQQIHNFILQPPEQATEQDFQALALKLFSYQYDHLLPYRRLCDAQNATPASVEQWADIPAVPAAAFRSFDLSCVPLSEAPLVFHSSGTTEKQTSKHYLDQDALALYETSLTCGFRLAVPNAPPKIWALMPPPHAAPHSSLTHMLKTLGAERFFWENNTDISSALHSLVEPLCLFGTAFALMHLFDSTVDAWSLPQGSVVIETGGFKGRSREVSREELYLMLQTRLGVPLSSCYSEYGMCEMTSQFYGHGAGLVKRGPHWTRTRVINMETGANAERKQTGLLRHYDLANFNSVLCLQTQDAGTKFDLDGFILHGRDLHAPLRGCSLQAEEAWA